MNGKYKWIVNESRRLHEAGVTAASCDKILYEHAIEMVRFLDLILKNIPYIFIMLFTLTLIYFTLCCILKYKCIADLANSLAIIISYNPNMLSVCSILKALRFGI